MRAEALGASGGGRTVVVVDAAARVPALLPGVGGLRVRARAACAPREARARSGQALPLVLAPLRLVVAGAVALFALGRVAAWRRSQAQTAADVAAVSAARELRAGSARCARRPGGGGGCARAWRRRLRRRPRGRALRRARGSRGCAFPDGAAWPPTAVEVTVSVAAPGDQRVRAPARAGLTIAAAPCAEGRTGWASGGGYSGPLVYRDGKPMCPAVAAAFDLMDAAARSEGVDLVVTSGFRSDAEQAVLFARHPDPRWVAPPGRSRHRDATELDLNMVGGGAAHAWLAAHGGGLRLPPALLLGALALGLPAGVRWGEPDRRRRRRRPPAAVGAARLGAGALPRARHLRGARRGPAADPARGAPPIRVGLRPACGEPGRGAGDRPVHARDRARAWACATRSTPPRRSRRRRGCWRATCGRSARCRWRWPPTTPARGRSGGTGGSRPTGDPGLRGARSSPWREARRPSREAPPATASPSSERAIDSSDPTEGMLAYHETDHDQAARRARRPAAQGGGAPRG